MSAAARDRGGLRGELGPTAAEAQAQNPAETAGNTSGPWNIGAAARRSGVSVRMVRHYESLGLLPDVPRTDAGYRQYGEREVHTLRFIRRARELGFSMADTGALLGLWQDRGRASGDVKRIALAQVAELDRRMQAMAEMRSTLQHLAACCAGDGRPDCPIIEDLAGQGEGTGQRQGETVGEPRRGARRPAAEKAGSPSTH